MSLTREVFDEAMRQIRDRRWICKGCAFETYLDPVRGAVPGGLMVSSCPECGANDWKQTSKPKPDAA